MSAKVPGAHDETLTVKGDKGVMFADTLITGVEVRQDQAYVPHRGQDPNVWTASLEQKLIIIRPRRQSLGWALHTSFGPFSDLMRVTALVPSPYIVSSTNEGSHEHEEIRVVLC